MNREPRSSSAGARGSRREGCDGLECRQQDAAKVWSVVASIVGTGIPLRVGAAGVGPGSGWKSRARCSAHGGC